MMLGFISNSSSLCFFHHSHLPLLPISPTFKCSALELSWVLRAPTYTLILLALSLLLTHETWPPTWSKGRDGAASQCFPVLIRFQLKTSPFGSSLLISGRDI